MTLPLSMPGVVSGITMTFLPAMTNYVILDMMYNSTYIMGSLIGSYFNIYDWNNGSMISLILFGLICLVSWVTGRGGANDAGEQGGDIMMKKILSHTWLVFVALFMYVPVLILAFYSFTESTAIGAVRDSPCRIM